MDMLHEEWKAKFELINLKKRTLFQIHDTKAWPHRDLNFDDLKKNWDRNRDRDRNPISI